ncbi:MAG: hypothetical protein HQK66_11740 [Desulfamplus sp.]|nr:hypothetical protein [Desulfamplus sp.]
MESEILFQITVGEGELVFYHPSHDFHDRGDGRGSSKSAGRSPVNYNDNSVVFKLLFRNSTILFPGDIMKNVESMLSRNHAHELKSDILIAPHHGSATSSTDIFIDTVNPGAVIISCGWKNRFGFPNEEVVDRYRQKGIDIYRTDIHGAVTLYSDGNGWNIVTFRPHVNHY